MRYPSVLAASLTAVLFLLNLGCPALSHSDEHEEGTNPPGDRDYFDFGDTGGGHGDDDDWGDDDDAWGDDDAMGDDDDAMGGMDEGDFLAAGMPLICALLIECLPSKKIELLGWETVDDCVDDEFLVLSMMTACPDGYTYDGSYAQACLNELEAATCASFDDPHAMGSCQQVMYCDELPD